MSQDDEILIPAPFERFYDLSDLSDAGAEIVLDVGPDDLPRLAEWLEIEAVDPLPCRHHPDAVWARIASATTPIWRPIWSRPAWFRWNRCPATIPTMSPGFCTSNRGVAAPGPEVEPGGVLTLSAADDEVPEELDSPRYDLAIPLLEELVLGLDPYPRAGGVAFELPAEHRVEKESPFAALKRLKQEP